ncbi:helix-turn-helix transcriptional regulator [Variovorax gossypii]
MAGWDSGLMGAVVAASRAASDASRWQEMLSALCLRFDATAACVHTPQNTDGERGLFVDHGLPTHTLPDYVSYWAPRDPWMASAAAKGTCVHAGEVSIGRELVDWDTLDRLDYFHEFAAPTGVKGLLAMIVDDGTQPSVAPFTVIGLYRRPGREEFSFQDKRAFQAVHAPLQLALHAHWALNRSVAVERETLELLDAVPKPLMLLARDARVLHANTAAAGLLARNGWVGTRYGMLVRMGQLGVDAIGASLRLVAQGQLQTHALWKPGPAGARATARMVPLEQRNATRLKWPDAVALLMIDEPEALSPERRLAQVAVQFRLSPTELKLTQALMQGDTLARFAEHQSIAISTVRTHLRHIFEKTGVRRQGDLIRLVGEAQGRAA